MRNLTDAEIEVLAPRVQLVTETIFVGFKKILKQPEYKDLAAAVDTEKFEMFLMNSSLSKSLQSFKSIEVPDLPSPIHVAAEVCFAFKPIGKATSLAPNAASGLYGIGGDLDKPAGIRAKVSSIEKEHLWVYPEATGSNKDAEFANSIISKADLCPADYCLLLRIDFSFKI